MKVCVVAENVSKKMSGEALLAYQFVRFMHQRDVRVELVCHERVRGELESSWTEQDMRHVHFVPESRLQSLLWKFGSILPFRIRDLIVTQLIHLLTQLRARRVVRDLVGQRRVDVVFQPAPISPKSVSCLFGVGAPVVIGPMCGGLEFPPAFRFLDSWFSRLTVRFARIGSNLLHRLFPGKLRADALIVANCCTHKALPHGYRGKVHRVVESGVDLRFWNDAQADRPEEDAMASCRFLYLGRFVDWKGIGYLVRAFESASRQAPMQLDLVGDGELMSQIRADIDRLKLGDRVQLHGWIGRDQLPELLRASDCLVMPSLRECGGTAMLEAMAMGLPLIGTNWAGPKSYIDQACGILVEPSSPDEFVAGLSQAMVRLANDPQLRREMGQASRRRVKHECFSWEKKTDRVLAILTETMANNSLGAGDTESAKPSLPAELVGL